MNEKAEFSVVEIEVNSRCNRKCSYCPVSVLPIPQTPRYMADEVFMKVVQELAEMDFSGFFSYHFYNEPLLRKDLDQLVAITQKYVPNAYQLLYTNGDLLTDEVFNRLLKAGIKHFIVTRHDNTPIAKRPNQTVQYPDDLTLVNRAGLLQHIEEVKEPFKTPCFAPSDNLIITSSGDILICCDDSERKEVMGNLMDKSIHEIWFSDKFSHYRALLSKGDRQNASALCKSCNNLEYAGPGMNYQSHLLLSGDE